VSSTPFVVSIAVDAVIDALGSFLTPLVGSCPIVRGQQNRVPPPADPPGFVKLTEILRVDIETPTVSGVANGQVSITSPKRFDIQVDFYGISSGDQSAAVQGVFRTAYAVAQFPTGIAPLYCSDAHQAPLTTGEEQYEARWTLTASLQYNPSVYIPQQSATKLGPVILEDLK
jgi:hypothetical protein